MSAPSAKDLIDSLRQVYHGREEFFLHEPIVGVSEEAFISSCLKEGWISSASAWGRKFENAICSFTSSKHSIVTVNGTSALHCALLAVGINPGDEVIVPAISFIATANAVSYTGATPHFVDSEDITLGIDPIKLDKYLSQETLPHKDGVLNKKTNKIIKALILVHTFGHPAQIDEIFKICEKYKLIFIEDAAESLGSFYKNKHTGCFSRVSILSFNGNKIVTTGGGGAVLTQDQLLADQIRHLSTTAKVAHPWEYSHDQIGFNYRMPGINAAMGCAQMQKLNEFILKKRELARMVMSALKNHSAVKLITEPQNTRSNYWLITVKLNTNSLEERNSILKILHDEKIYARPIWNLIPNLPMYKNCPRMNLDTALDLEKKVVNLPSSAFLVE